MYAFISNEYKTIVNTQRELNYLLSIYSYPKFAKVSTKEEAKKFFADNDRAWLKSGMKQNGRLNKVGYITIEYFLDGINIYYNVHTEHFGYIKLKNLPANVKCDSGYDRMKFKVCGVRLDNSLIAHHCIAITRILKLFGDTINIELILPDLSIYLAIVKYTGKNFQINNLQDMIHNRSGETYYTIT